MLTATLVLVLSQSPDAGTLPELRRLAQKLEPGVESPWVKQWLENVKTLPSITPGAAYCTPDKQRCEAREVPDAGLVRRSIDDEYVYTRITDPLGYARAFEVLATHGFKPAGAKVLDFGYGNPGQLVMLARLGAEVHGVEVDALLPLAAKSLTGRQGKGSVRLHHGYFPSDARLVKALGGGYSLWLSKNTMKRGYVHPAEPPGAKPQIDLGDDATLLATIHRELKPSGLWFIYNIAPKQQATYVPMADGRCPWSQEQLTAAGFEVLGFDVDDSTAMRTMGHALEWDDDGTDIDAEFFATWTLVRRK
jgi:hypothetical protein